MTHIWIPIVAVALLQWASHYFPWVRVFKADKPPRLIAYSIGVFAMLFPLSLWAWITGNDVPAWSLWASAASSGIGVGLGYAWDRWTDMSLTAEELREQAELLKVQRDSQD